MKCRFIQLGFGVRLNLANALQISKVFRGNIECVKGDFFEASNVESFLVLLLQTARETDEAITCLMRAIDLQPGYAQSYFDLGMIYQELQYIDEAISVYTKARVKLITLKRCLLVRSTRRGEH